MPPSMALPPTPRQPRFVPPPPVPPKDYRDHPADSDQSSPIASLTTSHTVEFQQDSVTPPKRPPRPRSELLLDLCWQDHGSANPLGSCWIEPEALRSARQRVHIAARSHKSVRTADKHMPAIRDALSSNEPLLDDATARHKTELFNGTHHEPSAPTSKTSPNTMWRSSLSPNKTGPEPFGLRTMQKEGGSSRWTKYKATSTSPEVSLKRPNTGQSALSPGSTQIHLRGGSVVTVTPPELNPWHRTTYLQGPIKLCKPHTMRRTSVATLEPFQDAVDKVFKDGESITKRRSDLAVAEDICTFFLDFELGEYGYGGDVLAVEGAEDSDESDEELSFQCLGQISETPPDSPTGWQTQTRLAGVEVPILPPVENEETLRGNGINWLARQRLRTPLLSPSRALSPIPEPETSTLDAMRGPVSDNPQHSTDSKRSVIVRWREEEVVEEIGRAVSWVKGAGTVCQSAQGSGFTAADFAVKQTSSRDS